MNVTGAFSDRERSVLSLAFLDPEKKKKKKTFQLSKYSSDGIEAGNPLPTGRGCRGGPRARPALSGLTAEKVR